MLGSHVVYHVHEGHRTVTKKSEEEHHGSIHHPELTEFAGLVTRVHPSGVKGEPDKCDLVIFPPNRSPVHISAATRGHGPHEFEIVET